MVFDLGTTCTTEYIDDSGGLNLSGGSVGPSSTSGGGSSSNPPPSPCSVPTTAAVSPNSHLIIRVAQSTSGFPPPTSTTSPCPNETVTTQVDTIGKIVKQPTPLTARQLAQLQAVLNQLLQNCLGQAVFNYFTTNGDQFDFEVISGISEQASYNPSSGVINIKDPTTLTPAALQEEFFHAYQNFTYPGGTAQYAGQSGSANIEFEAKVVKDISLEMDLLNGTSKGGSLSIIDGNYTNWLSSITSNFTKYPTGFTQLQLSQYFGFISEFLQQNPGYSNDIMDPNLNPAALFNLVNISPCSH